MSDQGTVDGMIVELLPSGHPRASDDTVAALRSQLVEHFALAAGRRRRAQRAGLVARQLADRPPRYVADGPESLPPPTSMLELVDAVLTAAPPAPPAPIHAGAPT